MSNKRKFKCKSEAQKRAIRANYARMAEEKKKQERIEAEYPHFRYHLKGEHPALVLDEVLDDNDSKNDKYLYRTVTHEDRHKRRNNDEVFPNPDPKDPEPMYIMKRKRLDNKTNFELKPLPWIVPDELKNKK